VTLKPTRRAAVLAALALGACGRKASADATPPLPALKSLAPFPLGLAGMSEQGDDLAWTEIARTHFDRLTPEWEMKPEAIVAADGGFDWSRPDAILALADRLGLKVFGHTLVWYSQASPAFVKLDGSGQAFADAYRTYILGVAGRYQGRVVGWDVVNEAIGDDAVMRDCLWRANLGDDYVRLAFQHAHEADPGAVLFLNDYGLETTPAKRLAFLKLAESLLAAGAPLGGLGTQTHVRADLAPGAIKAAVHDLGRLGLPVHISELDIGLSRVRGAGLRMADLEKKQVMLYAEAAEAMRALPPAQRFGITLWGARDRDSWLRRPPENRGSNDDKPLLFDDAGAAKPVARAFAAALRRPG
jgi:endo-1,4-beta-xylanase